MRSSFIRWVVVCAAGASLAGCGDGAPSASTPATTAPKPAKPARNPLAAEMVAAVSSPRSAEFVGVHFMLNGIPTVGKPLPVDIAFVPHRPMASLLAHFDARDGLALATGGELDRQVAPKPESVIKHQLILLPGKEGVFMVTVAVESESDAGVRTHVFSIPVIVGPPGATGAETPPAGSAPPAVEPPGAPPASG
jgi:hypothetical protein